MARIRGRRCKRSSAWNREWARQSGLVLGHSPGPYTALTHAPTERQQFPKVFHPQSVAQRQHLDHRCTYGTRVACSTSRSTSHSCRRPGMSPDIFCVDIASGQVDSLSNRLDNTIPIGHGRGSWSS